MSTGFLFKELNVKTVLYTRIQFSVRTVSMSKAVPFQTIQFSISPQFKCKYGLSKTFLFQAIQFSLTVLIPTIQFSISMQLVLFNPSIGAYQVLPFWTRVELGAMAIKWYSVFPKAPALVEPHHQIDPLLRCSRRILQPQPTGHIYIYIYIYIPPQKNI